MQVTVFDKVSFTTTEREYMDNGFLRVPGRVARTGIQDYLACELGLDGDPTRVVKVMRPESEVFNDSAMSSYEGVDVTIEHPKSFVDAESYKDISKGTVLNAVRDGDFVKADVIIKSEDAIKEVESGKVQLSAGYSAVYVEATDSDPFDYIQTNIRINHVAVVSKARAGAQARLFDNHPNPPEKDMIKVVLDSGRSVELEDGATAALISDSFERLTTRATDAEGKLGEIQATADAQGEKINQLEADLKLANDGEALKSKLADLAQVKDAAVRIAGKEFTCDSVDSLEIKREALKVVRDSIEWSEQSESYINGAFNFADAESKKDDEDEEDAKKAEDSKAQLAADAAKVVKAVDSRGKRDFMDSNLWKVNAGQMTMAELKTKANEQYGG